METHKALQAARIARSKKDFTTAQVIESLVKERDELLESYKCKTVIESGIFVATRAFTLFGHTSMVDVKECQILKVTESNDGHAELVTVDTGNTTIEAYPDEILRHCSVMETTRDEPGI